MTTDACSAVMSYNDQKRRMIRKSTRVSICFSSFSPNENDEIHENVGSAKARKDPRNFEESQKICMCTCFTSPQEMKERNTGNLGTKQKAARNQIKCLVIIKMQVNQFMQALSCSVSFRWIYNAIEYKHDANSFA